MDRPFVHYHVLTMIHSRPGRINPARSLRADALAHLLGAGLLSLATAALLASGGGFGLQGFLLTALLAALSGAVLLAALPEALPGNRFGRANSVTLGRLALTCVLAGALAGEQTLGTLGSGTAWSLCLIAGLSLLLDGLDGWLARRYGEATSFGARFDMEADALFLLVVALLVAATGKAGAWVLLSGLWRYGFVALGWLWPRLRGALPESARRKRVFVAQALLLIVCLAPPVTPTLGAALACTGLLLLSLSFLLDLLWLLRRSPTGGSTR